MKKVRIKKDVYEDNPYYDDCVKIQNVLKKHGYEATTDECRKIWENYSDIYCAGWLGLPDSDQGIWWEVKSQIEEYEEYTNL